MHPFRPLILALTAAVGLSCAAGPAPERVPKDIHQAIRHFNKGTAYFIKGCYPKALQHIQNAHERFVAADHLQGAADSLNSMSNTYYRMGDFTRAVTIYDEAIDLFRQLDDRTGLIRALANKSATLAAAGILDQAARTLDQADKAAEGPHMLTALRLKTRALLLMGQNDPNGAEALLVKSLRAAVDDERALLADIHYTLGHVMLMTRRPEMAIDHLETALELDRAAGAYYSIGMDLAELGSCFEDMGQHAEAAARFMRSLKIFALVEAPHRVQWVLPRLITSAEKAEPQDLSLQATMQWSEQWLAGQREANLCR